MTKEEYNYRLSLINQERHKAVSELQSEFAFSNNKIELGSFIRQNGFTIQVDRIGVYITGEMIPICSYHGFMYTTELKQRKDKRRHNIYNNSNIEVL